MQIIVGDVDKAIARQEVVYLVPTTWDDYSYVTEFVLHYGSPSFPVTEQGRTKILARNYKQRGPFQELRTVDELSKVTSELKPEEFCSIGQNGWYYQQLGRLPKGAGLRILTALNDIAFSDERSPWWRNDIGLDTSLLRSASACQARLQARALFEGRPFEGQDHHILRFSRSQGFMIGGPATYEAVFDGTLDVPGRLHAVVGKNGVGKTSLLAGLLNWYGRPIVARDKWTYRPEFSRVVTLSYNPFDDVIRAYRAIENDENVEYLGRRPPKESFVSFVNKVENMKEITAEQWSTMLMDEFPDPVAMSKKVGTVTSGLMFPKLLAEAATDPSWQEFIGAVLEAPEITNALATDPIEATQLMSAGQRSLINLWAALFVKMSPLTLVLIDEPENFLHPSLVARFARSFNELLNLRKSFAIIATHSPIILQETPSRFVTILERDGDVTTTQQPEFETFGESIDNITDRLFSTDFRSSHWKKILTGFAESELTLEEAAAKVSGLELPLLARTYMMYAAKRRGRR